jgi:hypothetical protein
MSDDALQAVGSALKAAGISPHPHEVELLADRYQAYRDLVAGFDGVLGADEAFPELVFYPLGG